MASEDNEEPGIWVHACVMVRSTRAFVVRMERNRYIFEAVLFQVYFGGWVNGICQWVRHGNINVEITVQIFSLSNQLEAVRSSLSWSLLHCSIQTVNYQDSLPLIAGGPYGAFLRSFLKVRVRKIFKTGEGIILIIFSPLLD